MPQAVPLLGGYRPTAVQEAAHRSGARFLAMTAGTRGGKTEAGACEFIRRVYRDEQREPGTDKLYWVVGPTYKLVQTARRKLLRHLQAPWAVQWGRRYRHEYRSRGMTWPQAKGCRGLVLRNLRSQSEQVLYLAGSRNHGHGDGDSNLKVGFRTTSDPDSLVAEGLHGVWVDETARCKQGAWEGGLRARLTDHQGWGLFTTTPLGRNWYEREIHRRGDPHSDCYDPEYASHVWRTVDNTALPGIVEEAAKARRQLPLRYYQREYEASFSAFEGQIFDEFSRAMHCTDPQRLPDPGYFDRFVSGLDFGWVHPLCWQLWGIREPRNPEQGERREYWLLEEEWETHLPVWSPHEDCLAARIRRKSRWWLQASRQRSIPIYADPSRPESIAQLDQQGFTVYRATTDVVEGIECVAKAMHPVDGECPWFRVRADARGALHAYESYRWKDTPDGQRSESPLKVDDDGADATRYALLSDEVAHPLAA